MIWVALKKAGVGTAAAPAQMKEDSLREVRALLELAAGEMVHIFSVHVDDDTIPDDVFAYCDDDGTSGPVVFSRIDEMCQDIGFGSQVDAERFCKHWNERKPKR